MKKRPSHCSAHEHRELTLPEQEEKQERYTPIEERFPEIEDRTTDRRLVLWHPPQVWEEWARLSQEKIQG